MLKKIFKGIVMILFVLVIAYGIYFLFTETNFMRVTTINYTPHEEMDLFTIKHYSGVEEGVLFFKYPATKIEEKMKNHAYVENVEVKKVFPHTIEMNITYRKHAFNLFYSDIILSLDSDLIVLSVLDVPMQGYTVEGFAFDSFVTGEVINVQQQYLLKDINRLIQLLEKHEVHSSNLIEYKNNNIRLEVEGINVLFGLGENIEEKFYLFLDIHQYLKNDGISSGTIDVSSGGLPVYRPFGR